MRDEVPAPSTAPDSPSMPKHSWGSHLQDGSWRDDVRGRGGALVLSGRLHFCGLWFILGYSQNREKKRMVLHSSLVIDLSNYGCDQRCGTMVYLF